MFWSLIWVFGLITGISTVQHNLFCFIEFVKTFWFCLLVDGWSWNLLTQTCIISFWLLRIMDLIIRIDRNEIGFLYESFNHECASDIIIPHITHTNRDYPREKKRMDVTFWSDRSSFLTVSKNIALRMRFLRFNMNVVVFFWQYCN